MPNEQAFREFQYAVYSRNLEYFVNNLDKYGISYITWDTSVIASDYKNQEQVVYKHEIEQILNGLIEAKKVSFLSEFGTLKVYRVETDGKQVMVKNIKNSIGPKYKWNYIDYAYIYGGDYVTNSSKNSYYYPFRDILDVVDQVKKDVLEVDPDTASYNIHTKTPEEYQNVYIPNYFDAENAVFADIYIGRTNRPNRYKITFNFILPEGLIRPVDYEVEISSRTKDLNLTINGTPFSFNSDVLKDFPLYLGQTFIYTRTPNFINDTKILLAFTPDEDLIGSSQLFSKLPSRKISFNGASIAAINKGVRDIKVEGKTLHFETQNERTGVNLDLERLTHNLGYILIFKSKNLKGLPLRFCLRNWYSNLCSVYTELAKSNNKFTHDYFIVPPTGEATGYSLSIDNISYGQYKTVNELEEISIIPFPYDFLSQIYFSNNPAPLERQVVKSSKNKLNNDLPYKKVVSLQKQEKNSIAVLNQSYHPGWTAFQVDSSKFKVKSLEHVLVNNWGNGWRLDPQLSTSNSQLLILFWPQYLEYAGFTILAGTLGILIFLKIKK